MKRLIVVLVCVGVLPSSSYIEPVPYSVCVPKEIPKKAIIGDCYILR